MNILYLANARFPTEKAHGAQIMKSCEAFAKAGNPVTLVVPRRRTPIKEDPFTYYAVQETFPVRKLFTFDTVRFGKLGFLIQSFSFAFSAALFARRREHDVIYTRDEVVAAVALFIGLRKVVWESHDGAWNSAARYAARRVFKMVTVTQGGKEFYILHGISEDKIAAIPNGIDLDAFTKTESKEVARQRLGIPDDARIALYVGALDGWKGTDTLLEASRFLQDVTIAIIGGSSQRIKELEKNYPDVLFLGSRPYRELPDNLAAADVCVLPNTAKDPISVTFTCPLKLLAYMAAGKPIVATDIPTTRELVGDGSALLVPPDDPKKLAKGIEIMLQNTTQAIAFVAEAQAHVQTYDWLRRVSKVLKWITRE